MATISLNELITTSSKIAEIHGFTWGMDLDFSEQICWLELNQLEGLKRLRQILDVESLTSAPKIDYDIKPASLNIDAGNQSACCFSLACIDLAVGLYQQGAEIFKHFEVNINNTRDGVFFLAALGYIRFAGTALISGTDNNRLFQTFISEGSFTTHWFGPSRSSNLSVHIKIGTEPFAVESGDEFLTCDELETQTHISQRKTALENGINVDTEIWASLVDYSHRILVPASERSREFGTGGGDAND